jgi:hypothetical protein
MDASIGSAFFKSTFLSFSSLLLCLVFAQNSIGDELEIPLNPSIRIKVPAETDIVTYKEGNKILRCCGTKTCIKCNPLEFDPTRHNGYLPNLNPGDVLMLQHVSKDPRKSIELCPDANGIPHQCLEIFVDLPQINPQ